MKRLALLLVIVVCALLAPSTASTHVGSWHWPVSHCKHRLVADDLNFRGSYMYVTAARCFGIGAPTYFAHSPGVKQYKRFDVIFRNGEGVWRCGEFHVAGQRNWHLDFVVLVGKGWCR